MNVKLLKFANGEEVLADTKENSNNYTLKNAVRIGMTHEGLGMAPLSPLAKLSKELTIDKIHVVCLLDPEDEIINIYNSHFGTGIIMPSSNVKLKI